MGGFAHRVQGRQAVGGFARGHTRILIFLRRALGTPCAILGQPDRQVSPTIQGRSSNHSAPVCKPAQEENLIGQSNKSVEEQWSQWTAGELWRVECETQSLRH